MLQPCSQSLIRLYNFGSNESGAGGNHEVYGARETTIKSSIRADSLRGSDPDPGELLRDYRVMDAYQTDSLQAYRGSNDQQLQRRNGSRAGCGTRTYKVQ